MMGRAELDGAEMDAISLDAVLSAQPTWAFLVGGCRSFSCLGSSKQGSHYVGLNKLT